MEDASDEESATTSDKNFHFAIAKASGNSLLNQMLNAISALINSFISDIRHSIMQTEENKPRLLEIHRGIFNGIKNRDIELARASIKEHSIIISENLKF